MSFIDSMLNSQKKVGEFYDLLGCDRSSTAEQIQAEYRSRVRAFHPDKFPEEEREHANAMFSALQNAYAVLCDDGQRKVYDLWLESPLPMTFEKFSRNADAVKMSMHWVTPKQQPMISLSELNSSKTSQPSSDRWTDGKRYQSDSVSKFRNYQL
ncbi:unnamed protein product [Caenorhabditis auriculariae]|uniref:J domain-containing protein n=1 Tax=Caenorhabditis auriculariae TaxID=2777116 RepID=A0A8S1HN01_9PELO|nr:unnamed protein product [Caenorhabditis auriculariae]